MAFAKKTIRDIDLRGKKVLIRADYNVPLKGDKIQDDYRIKQSLPTIKYILSQSPAALILISHLGRPDGPQDKDCSLAPVAARLTQLLNQHVEFVSDCVGEAVSSAVSRVPVGGLALLENLRFHKEEEANDKSFAQEIVTATGAQIFVADGFGVVHRAHASTDAIAGLLPAVAGLLLEKEVDTITSVMADPKHPLVAVVGGAKISDKIDVITKLMDIADCVAVGGALANDFLKVQRIGIGASLYDEDSLNLARDILAKAVEVEKKRNFKFLVPGDVVVAKDASGRARTRVVDLTEHMLADQQSYPKTPPRQAHSVAADEKIMDVGPVSAARIAGAIDMAATVIWSGTMGVTEIKGIAGARDPFGHGTRVIVESMIGESNNHANKPFTVVGGGDTVAYVESQGLVNDFNHVSTGGSASLELMAGRKLPGVEALEDK
ncbi:MAG TPA: phosphoglycerate kinase [Candidatus Saccharimonadales bacterium]|nr:phosphoglycerate kinase [Candidatus Saccharimonadales bacterium]